MDNTAKVSNKHPALVDCRSANLYSMIQIKQTGHQRQFHKQELQYNSSSIYAKEFCLIFAN